MIKLTKVTSDSSTYDPDARTVISTFSLGSLYINPDYIISMTPNKKFNEMHTRKPVVEGLIPEARFTKIIVAAGTNGTTCYDVLGTPEQHVKLIGDDLK